MEMELILQRIVGLSLAIAAIGLFFRRHYWAGMITEFYQSKALTYVAAILSLGIGSTIVVLHNNWAFESGLVVTLFGWAGLVKGGVLMIWPESIQSLFSESKSLTEGEESPARSRLSKILGIEAPIIEILGLLALWGSFADA